MTMVWRHVAVWVVFGLAVGVASGETPPPLEITVDATKVVGPCDNVLWGNIGFDPLYAEITAEESRPVLRMIRESGAFRYLRCHNYFSDGLPAQRRTYFGCRVYSEDEKGAPRYQWWFLDEVLDRVLAAGMRPIVECDFMPDALAEGEPLRNYGGGLINTPKDYKKWRDLVFETVRHCEQRYGADEVRQWRWELWNEPDLERYFVDGWGRGRAGEWSPRMVDRLNKMYDYMVDGAVAADPQIKVGGPGLAGNAAYLRAFLDHCVNGVNAATGKKGARIDFISWHGYGRTPALLKKNAQFRESIVREFPSLSRLEMQQNEWGQTLNIAGKPAPMWPAFSEFEAAFLCRYVDAMYSERGAGVNLFLRWGQLKSLGNGGWRTLTRYVGGEPLPFPIFHAYVLLGKLGPERVAVRQPDAPATVRAIAARTDPKSVQVLLYRFEENNEDGTGAPVEVNVNVSGLSGAVDEAREYRIDRTHSNFYRVWEKAGRPPQAGGELARQLQKAARLSIAKAALIAAAKEPRFRVSLPPNSVVLVTLNGEHRRDNRPRGPHIERVVGADEKLDQARTLVREGNTTGAATALLAAAKEYPDLYVAQCALRSLIALYDTDPNRAAEADRMRARLLETTLGDDERLGLLETRAVFARRQERSDEAKKLEAEIAAVRPRVQRRGAWSP